MSFNLSKVEIPRDLCSHIGSLLFTIANDTEIKPASANEDGKLIVKSQNEIWNTDTLAWESATGSLSGGGNVTVNNFPASYAVTNADITSIKTNTNSVNTLVSTTITLTLANTAYLLPASEQSARRSIIVYNNSDTDCYIGASGVTTATGILLASGATMSLDCSSGLYGVCGTAGKTLNVLEMK